MLSLLLCGAMCAGLLSGCGNASSADVLNVYNWGEYIDTDLIDQFEEKTGIKVIYNTFDSNENLYSRIQTTSYDVIIPSDYAISRFIDEDMLQPLNYDHIPNMKLIDEKYTHLDFDPEQKYSVPYTWGVVGIVYNTKYVDEADIGSWDLLWNPKYTNRTAMFNNSRDALGIALMYLGYSLNTTDKAQIDEAKQLLIKQKPMLKAYLVETEARDAMISGEAAMALVYNGEAYLAIEGDEEQNISGNPDLKFTIPEEGTNFWIDSWVVPTYSSNKADAEAFINYLCGVEAAKKNFEYIYYSTPNQALYNALDPEVQQDEDIFPSREVIDKGEVYHDLGADLDAYYSASWKEIKS